MSRAKAFFVTFTAAFCVVLTGYMVLYGIIRHSIKETDTYQKGVPVVRAGVEDSKTCLVVLDCSKARFYFLLKLNAIQNKINLVSIPAGFYLDKPQRTLDESMDYAGVMQCVQDLSAHFDLTVDCFVVCDGESMAKLTESFDDFATAGADVPQSVKHYLLNDSEYVDTSTLFAAVDMASDVLDNHLGIEFVNRAMYSLICENLQQLQNDVPRAIKENFSDLNTDLGTQQLDRMERIMYLLNRGECQCDRLVLVGDTDGRAEVDRLMKE